MKLLSKIVFLLTISLACIASHMVDYHSIIQPCVTMWQNECISQLSKQELITITDMILLSYQVVQASVVMSQARLIIQSELFDIVSLSINDTIDAQMQAQNNDLTRIKSAISAIEDAQEKIKFACNALKSFGPLIININPIVIQLFISNLKDAILSWVKIQQKTMIGLEDVQQKFGANDLLFSNLKNMYETVASTNPAEHSQLLHGANNLTDLYKKTENIFADLTVIRQESIANFNALLTLFFKYHYQALYDQLQSIDDNTDINLIATSDHKLPLPEDIFVLG